MRADTQVCPVPSTCVWHTLTFIYVNAQTNSHYTYKHTHTLETNGPAKMAQQLRALADKPDDLMPGTHNVEEEN